MAAGNSVGDLYLRLGLNLSDLETGFVTASQTVAANISRLNRESNLVRIRSEVEIAGLDETADATRILQIRTDALNQQMQIQRDRIRILDAEYQNLVQSQGANSVAAQRATVRLERERLALANLERESRNLNNAQEETNDVLGELNNILPEMPTKLGAIEMAFGAITSGVGAAAVAVQELMTNFRELQTQSYELNMPFADTKQFLRELKLAGGDIGDFEGYIRGITDAYVKGEWDDPEFIALRKYNAQITDATGRLKNFKDISEEVFQAWEKADAAGEGIEFLQLTGGEMGVRDTIQLFKRLKEAREDAAKIYDAKLDEKQLHELDRVFGRTVEQAGELKSALGNIFAPAAMTIGEEFFQLFHDGTAYLVENRNELQKWSFVAIEAFSTVKEKLAELKENTNVDNALSVLDWRGTLWEKISSILPDDLFGGVIDRAAEKQKKFNAELGKTLTVSETIAKGLSALKVDDNPLSQYASKRIQQFKDDLEDLQIEIDFGDNDYQKKIAELNLWRERELTDKLQVSSEERLAIEKLYAAKLELIEKEHADKIAEYWSNAADIQYEMTHTAFEKELRDIEKWKDAQLEKASTAEEVAGIIAESAAKEAQAFEREVDRIKGQMQSLDDKIFALDHSQYENDLRRIQQEYLREVQEAQEAGTLPLLKDKLDYLYQRQKQELDKKAKEGGDYTKTPNGGLQRGGNGIVVIGGDTVLDDGLIKIRQAEIGLITDENKIRASLSQNLSDDARALIAAQQAMKNFSNVQNFLATSTQKAASGFQVIEGDRVVSSPEFVMPEISTEPLQEFNSALQQANSNFDSFNFADTNQALLDAQKNISNALNSFPTDYLKNLADGSKSLSEMQLSLTNSTLALIDAQKKLHDALLNLPEPKTKSQNDQLPTDSFQRLSTSTQGLTQAQDLLARRTREEIPIMRSEKKGLNFGFDMDTAGTALGLGALLAGIGGAPITAPAAAGIAALSALGGLAKGTYDNSTATSPVAGTDLTPLTTPLMNIDAKVQSILQEFQAQGTQQVSLPVETIVTPLNNISSTVERILGALGNHASQPINVSPNLDINLAGAYVFDEALKKSLVTDITNKIVTAITNAVQQATRQPRNFSYGA